MYHYWLARQETILSSRRIRAESVAGSPEALFEMSEHDLRSLQIFTEEDIRKLISARDRQILVAQWQEFQRSDIELLTYHDARYPDRLKRISQPPYAMFVRGRVPLGRPAVGIVGARMCSEYGRSIARKLGRELAKRRIHVISGMAKGVDSASHAGALEEGGATFAVLGCGCDICYPRSSVHLYENMISGCGGILSEYVPGTEPMGWHFPARNRIISALSDVLVVVEAREKSGSLITADFALEQGKDIYAVPGRLDDSLSAGCNRLIAQGAGILTDVKKFLEDTGLEEQALPGEDNIHNLILEKEELLVYSCLDLHPKFINQIIDDTGYDLLTVIRALDQLKKKNLVLETFQNYYVKNI